MLGQVLNGGEPRNYEGLEVGKLEEAGLVHLHSLLPRAATCCGFEQERLTEWESLTRDFTRVNCAPCLAAWDELVENLFEKEWKGDLSNGK
jgi:3'-phosphoadenosine 5'-phosphosulfate sulfotransferase (PAPS reductase)/FAD synthetase